jgi:hypothetical protein
MKIKQLAAMTVLAVAAGTFAHAQTSAPVKDDLFAGTEVFAKGASDVTEVTMDPDSLGMVSGKDKMRAHTMVLNVVRTYEYDKPGMYNIADVEVFRSKLNTGDWHCSVHTRSSRNSESTDICNKRRTDDMVETAIITVEPKELTFIHTIRKRGSGEGMGPMGPMGPGEAMMLMPHISVLPQMAMLSVQPQIDMALSTINSMDFSAMKAEMAAKAQAMKAINSAEMQRHMAEAQLALRDAQKSLQDDKEADKHGDKKPE